MAKTAQVKMSALDWTATILVLAGALNWGLIGFFNLDILSKLFGAETFVTKGLFGLVGLAGLWVIYSLSTK